jgi:hypothetical protein
MHVVSALAIVDESYILALSRVNKIRNDCAHQKNRKIKQKDLESIGTPLGNRYQEMKRTEYSDQEVFIKLLSTISSHFVGKWFKRMYKMEENS